ncbi:MAG TPA: flagellar biosynthetic protein FliR [Tepidisphaeraceae bacterium]|nr:flagellar biosynthetic protein FliR [Tepidisphaeraceae bacterium]
MPILLLQYVPTFVLVFFRLAGMMLFAPLFGSARIPRVVRVMLVLVLAFGVTPSIGRLAVLPDSPWELALDIGSEMAFGLAMGMVMSFTFIAAQWAGEIIGQQIGFNLSEVFDPQFGAQGSLVGDIYFMLTQVIFLVVGGHRMMIQGVRASFDVLPLLSLGIDEPLLKMMCGLLQGATILAMQLAAPMLVTTMVVDLVLGLIGKTMPQMNVMAAGLSMKSTIGILVVIIGLGLTVSVIRTSVKQSMLQVWDGWTTHEGKG